MSRSGISSDGKWAMYLVQNGAIDGEATLHIHNTKTAREYVIERGADPQITDDSRFALFRVTPDKKKLKQLRKEKRPDSELPKSKLQILELSSGDIRTIEGVRSFRIPEEHGGWVACLMEKPGGTGDMDEQKSSEREVYEVTRQGLQRPAKKQPLKSREQLARERGELEPEKVTTEEEKKEAKGKEEKDSEASAKKKKTSGSPLMLLQLGSDIRRTFPAAVSFTFSKNGKTFVYSTSVATPDDSKGEKADDEAPVDGVHIIKLDSLDRMTIAKGVGDYKNMTVTDDGSQVAFLTNKDDYESKTSTWAVYHWSAKSKEAKKIAAEGDEGMNAGWWVSPNSSQRFSDDLRRLYFETAPVPDDVVEERAAKKEGRKVKEEDSSDKAKLDIWHWQDPLLQPQQLLQAEAEKRRDYRAAYVIDSKEIVQLADREVPSVAIDYESPAGIAVANTDVSYRKALSWDRPGFQDIYVIDLDSGKREMILEKVKWSAFLSPEGKFVTWFDPEKKAWFAKKTKDKKAKTIEISKGIRFALQDELHDTPNLPPPYGAAGWSVDDKAFLIYDRYDIWKLDPTGKSDPECLTNGMGRQEEIRFRYRRIDPDERAVDLTKPMMLTAFNRKTKASGFYRWEPKPSKSKDAEDDTAKLVRLIMLDEALSLMTKAEDADTVLFTRSTFRDCPDLWMSDLEFKKIFRVSEINPQQDQYTWGSAELVHWTATDGQDLDGILMTPDGFDPEKKYPMMVYFYERNSDNLHRYYTPEAGRSIICHSFYVSRGYVVFIPDIPYKTGEPGPSAANAILPGVESLVAKGFVDEERIGMQGHSWGGYQTAYLVTQTDMFACAESGAPVSNMTSAYGGIRWGSGLSRMFQYERTQSRIGEDLWAARDKYIANSPLFFADKINTPLLILHNDEDGAVPWYQGIELFVALRRLEKPAWMLNYNGNPHWVMGDYNRRDFAIRMQQFFDHYLMDAPEPEWMAVGVPAVNKGESFGLELLEPK
ncbi:MAG: prolyl oligopeptidase family serine peptidase [Planctomycetota bacterium]